jgi:hypothetical protein
MRRWLIRTAALLAVAVPLAVTGGAAADHEAMDGMSFLFLQPPFTQDIYGIQPSFMGGVAFAPDGDPWTNDCAFSGSPLHRYDRQGVAPPPPSDPTTELHPRSDHPSNAGCGMTNHPNGSLYTNTGSGVVRLDASTGAQTGGPFGPGGNALGIAVDPETANLVYVGSDGTMHSVDPALTTTSVFSAATTGRFIDGIAFDPTGDFLFLSSRSPGFNLTVINGDTGAFIRDNPMTSEPDGISFHASTPKFVVTNNTDGTMTRMDFPADDYTLPGVASLFAGGGFRGDLSNVGPDGCIYLAQSGSRFDNGTTSFENSIVKICPGFAPPPGVGVEPQHFASYDLSMPERIGETVTLVDQFGTKTVRLEEIEWLMNPAEKRRTGMAAEPILRPDEHLTCHGFPVSSYTTHTVRVSNQFTGESTLRVGRPLTLCNPAAKTLTGTPGDPPTTAQHYECYDVQTETPLFHSETLAITDEFGARTIRIDRARELCNPVEKRRTGRPPELIKRPEEHFVCYRITTHSPSFAARTVFTRDEFRLDTLRVTSPRRLCVPSTKVEGAPPS